ncbi:MAG: aldo/keto reductase [Bacteroidota bacterium]
MNYRTLGKSNFQISELSLGTWQVGGKWGSGFDDALADRILQEAADQGINFIDTADVYEDGQSERAVGRLVRSRSERIYVATKCGRKINPHRSEGYSPEVLQQFVEDSLRRMQLESLDLIQLHCPPTAVYYRPEIFELFDRLREAGKIRHLGVSVEKVEEGLKALEYPNVTSIQIIYNVFRQRPQELLFREAQRRGVGIIVRVPLASGLLTGLYRADTHFAPTDHRHFNREGEAFDRGETFAGIDYELGLRAVEALRREFPRVENLAPVAIQWVLRHPAVTTVIPGASKVAHLHSNLSYQQLPAPTEAQLQAIDEIYQQYIQPSVHQLW